MISFLSAVYDIGMDIGVITVLLGQVLMRYVRHAQPEFGSDLRETSGGGGCCDRAGCPRRVSIAGYTCSNFTHE